MRIKAFGTHDIARICHVTPPTVGRWIEEGLLPSFTTGGGHRRVWDDDLVVFLRVHNIPIPSSLEHEATVRVLVVDDEPRLRQMVLRLLKKSYPHLEYHEAEDGFEAGKKISELTPALVLLDLRLPGVDGLKVCESVKSDERLQSTRVVGMTGYDVERSREEVRRAGADGFLAKPFKSEALLDEVRRFLPPVPVAAAAAASKVA